MTVVIIVLFEKINIHKLHAQKLFFRIGMFKAAGQIFVQISTISQFRQFIMHGKILQYTVRSLHILSVKRYISQPVL